MALSDYEIPRTTIKLDKRNKIEVRGLGLEDVSFLVRIHKGEVDDLINAFRKKVVNNDPAKNAEGNFDPTAIDDLVKSGGDDLIYGFLQQFPLLAANVIAVACDEPNSWQTARQLPLPTQVEALLAIARLTFEDAEGFKKFVGNVSAVLSSVRSPAPQKISKKTTKSTGSMD